MHLRGFVVVGCIKKNPSVFSSRQWMSFDGLQTDRQTVFIPLCALGSSLLPAFVAFLLGRQQKSEFLGY
jgi:hypothetical protein